MLKTVAQAWKVPEIRSKMIFTLLMLVVFRIGSNIPVPNINRSVLSEMFTGDAGLFDLFDLFSGGSFSNFTIFALSITPYITASIIVQLLTIAFPYFENLAKEGMEGRKKMAQITRYMTVVLALIQAIGLTVGLFRQAVVDKSAFSVIVVVLVLTAGTAFLMWLGEQINDRGIGNGISLLIFGGIVARIPSGLRSIVTSYQDGGISIVTLIIFVLLAVLVTAGVVLIQEGQRRIPVQYSKKMAGRKMVGGQSSNIPLKVNTAGVIPIIFASSIMSFPSIILSFVGKSDIKGIGGTLIKMLNSNNWFDKTNPVASLGLILYIVLVIFFAYFYTSITFNPMEVADNMKKQGGFIPGIRPGKSTVDYLNNLLSYIIFIGAAGLTIVAVIPFFFNGFFKANVSFGGTSLIIIASVILETLKQIESMMLVRNYKGFLND